MVFGYDAGKQDYQVEKAGENCQIMVQLLHRSDLRIMSIGICVRKKDMTHLKKSIQLTYRRTKKLIPYLW